MEAWSRLTKNPLSCWEVSVLREMDAALLRVSEEMRKKYEPKPKQQPRKRIK